MSEIKEQLEEIYKQCNTLRVLILPHNEALIRAGFKPLANQGLSELVKSASLIESIKYCEDE
jgi:hypothetical protein